MKKIYQAPVTEEVKIEPQLLQAGSPNISDTDALYGGDGNYGDSRSVGFFFDDDEDY